MRWFRPMSGKSSNNANLNEFAHAQKPNVPSWKRPLTLVNEPEHQVDKRYFFHVVGDDHTHEDKTGTVLSGDQAASLQASAIATELAKDPEYQGFMVYVVDDEGHEVVRQPVVAG
jgi:hypothetical protein